MYQRAGGHRLSLAGTSVFQRMSVEDNLMAICETLRLSRRERRRRVDELLDQFGLAIVRKNPAKNISGGERRKLEIARALTTARA